MARKRLGEILVEAGLITETQVQSALAEQKRWGGQLGKILVDMQMVHEAHMVQALANQLNFPIINLDTIQIDPNTLKMIDGETAENHSAIPFRSDTRFLDVAMANPTNMGIIDELRIRTQLNVRPYLAGPSMIQRALEKYFNRGQSGANFDPNDFEIVLRDDGRETVPSTSKASPTSKEETTVIEVQALQERVARLEALNQRNENVIRRLLGMLIEKGFATREEILQKLY